MKTYFVTPGKPVELTITVGYVQVGSSSVLLNGANLVSSQANPLKLVLAKDGGELDGKLAVCTSAVTAIRNETLQTSVSYTLTGGQKPYSGSLSEAAEARGDVIFYLATFFFHT
jgi:hypothetical protein